MDERTMVLVGLIIFGLIMLVVGGWLTVVGIRMTIRGLKGHRSRGRHAGPPGGTARRGGAKP